MPVLRFVENKDECTSAATAAESAAQESEKDDVDMGVGEMKVSGTVRCFCMLDSLHSVEKVMSGMNDLTVRDQQILSAQ